MNTVATRHITARCAKEDMGPSGGQLAQLTDLLFAEKTVKHRAFAAIHSQ